MAMKELLPTHIAQLKAPLAQRIAHELSRKAQHPRALAKLLNVDEQKIYYHIRKLEHAGIVVLENARIVNGVRRNIYALSADAFCVRFSNTTQETTPKKKSEYLSPFIIDGEFKARIIVGSPDPHGPEKARSRDGYYGIDFALFLGSYVNSVHNLHVQLDTETTEEDLQENLIILGGPVVNTAAGKLNKNLPIYFDKNNNWCLTSKISGKKYYSDETGIIVKLKNPFNKRKWVLVIAGKRHMGTRAVMIACMKHFEEIEKGNSIDNKIDARIIEGVDLDADGVVDDVEFLE